MFCPKCGTQNVAEALVCKQCGYRFTKTSVVSENTDSIPELTADALTDSNVTETPSSVFSSNSYATKGTKLIRLENLWFLIAAVVFVLSFVAAIMVFVGGLKIASIESVGGKTLEEAYYQYSGNVYFGYSLFVFAMGAFCSSVLSWIGLREKRK